MVAPSMSNVGQSTSTDSLLVAELRQSNDTKWERLKGLYDQASRLAESGADVEVGDPREDNNDNVVDRLRAEIDMLPRTRWAKESQEMMQMIERSIASRSTLPDIGSSAEGAEDRVVVEELWRSEIVSSYNNTKQIVEVLRQDVEREKETLQKLLEFRDETKEIHAELVAENRRLREEQEAPHLDESNGSVPSLGTSADPNSINQMLRSDLSYLSTRIDAQLCTGGKSEDDGIEEEAWSLDQLLHHLVSHLLRRDPSVTPGTEEDERMSNGEGDQGRAGDSSSVRSASECRGQDIPYLSIDDHPVRKEHVELLMKCCIVETHRDDENLIRLVDYRL